MNRGAQTRIVFIIFSGEILLLFRPMLGTRCLRISLLSNHWLNWKMKLFFRCSRPLPLTRRCGLLFFFRIRDIVTLSTVSITANKPRERARAKNQMRARSSRPVVMAKTNETAKWNKWFMRCETLWVGLVVLMAIAALLPFVVLIASKRYLTHTKSVTAKCNSGEPLDADTVDRFGSQISRWCFAWCLRAHTRNYLSIWSRAQRSPTEPYKI